MSYEKVNTIAKMDEQYLVEMSKQLTEVAPKLGIKLPDGLPIPGMIYMSSFAEKGYVASFAFKAGLDKLSIEDFDKGVVVGLAYIQLPAMPVGFYQMKIIKNQTLFINEAGIVISKMPTTISKEKHSAREKHFKLMVLADFSMDVFSHVAYISGHFLGRHVDISFETTITWR